MAMPHAFDQHLKTKESVDAYIKFGVEFLTAALKEKSAHSGKEDAEQDEVPVEFEMITIIGKKKWTEEILTLGRELFNFRCYIWHIVLNIYYYNISKGFWNSIWVTHDSDRNSLPIFSPKIHQTNLPTSLSEMVYVTLRDHPLIMIPLLIDPCQKSLSN